MADRLLMPSLSDVRRSCAAAGMSHGDTAWVVVLTPPPEAPEAHPLVYGVCATEGEAQKLARRVRRMGWTPQVSLVRDLLPSEEGAVSAFDLPTIEQCRAFRDEINEGRALIDLPPLEFLDFDGAMPDKPRACLGARNLFAHAGYAVRARSIVELRRPGSDRRVRDILLKGATLPESLLAVTRIFDACIDEDGDLDKEKVAALRARMVEAGVVAP